MATAYILYLCGAEFKPVKQFLGRNITKEIFSSIIVLLYTEQVQVSSFFSIF